jgi:hypothetical protein
VGRPDGHGPKPHPGPRRLLCGRSEGRVVQGAGAQERRVVTLHDKQHRGTAPQGDFPGQGLQVSRGAGTDRVRKVGAAIGIHEVAVLDLDQVVATGALEEQVDA